MSTGGVFQLITNTGLQDRLIMATDKLIENMNKIAKNNLEKQRKLNPNIPDKVLLTKEESWIPIVQDIEKTHLLFVNASFKPFVAMAHEYSKTPTRQGKASLGNSFSFTLPVIGDFVNDAVVYIKLTGLAAVSALDKVRYVEFLGHRLMKRVRFKVQNQIFDEYTSDTQNAYFQYKVPSHKEVGYLRNIGQEVPRLGYLTADPTTDEVREYRYFGDGAQTFKRTQSDVEMWIPILFWFKDIQNSLPNFLLPLNQTDIEIELEAESNLISFGDYGGGGSYTVPSVSECYLYLNHIFIQPEVAKVFMTRFGFQLIRVHRTHTEQLTRHSDRILLHQIKWPVECLYVCFRPRVNLTNSQRWHRGTNITEVDVHSAVITGVSTVAVNDATYLNEQPVISNMSLSANDITLFPEMKPEFYNNYIPIQYGATIKTPYNIGWMMVPFASKPGEYQPSGHLNVSRSRELYLSYVSNIVSNSYVIRPDNPTDLLVIAECINFILYKSGNACLKFST